MTPTSVVQGDVFLRNLKRLAKRYFNIQQDVDPLILRLEKGETPGDQVPGTGYTVFKVRLPSSDMQRGTSGGYRVIYYLKTRDYVVLLSIYAKTQQVDMSAEEIRRLIEFLE